MFRAPDAVVNRVLATFANDQRHTSIISACLCRFNNASCVRVLVCVHVCVSAFTVSPSLSLSERDMPMRECVCRRVCVCKHVCVMGDSVCVCVCVCVCA